MAKQQNFPLNIWGKRGCELPSGNLCDACCNVKFIDSPWGQKRFLKMGQTNCELMRRLKKGQGCGVYGMAPDACEIYHCSNDSDEEKIKLVKYALKNKLVTREEAREAINRIKKNN